MVPTRGREQAEQRSVSTLRLWIGGYVPVEESGQVHALQERSDDGQGAKVITGVATAGPEPVKGHSDGSFDADKGTRSDPGK